MVSCLSLLRGDWSSVPAVWQALSPPGSRAVSTARVVTPESVAVTLQVLPHLSLSFITFFWWRELSKPLVRSSSAWRAKKPWWSLQHHILVLETTGPGTCCCLCHPLGFLWPSFLAVLIIASNSSLPRTPPEWPQVRNLRLKLASVWRRSTPPGHTVPCPVSASPAGGTNCVLHCSPTDGEWLAARTSPTIHCFFPWCR